MRFAMEGWWISYMCSFFSRDHVLNCKMNKLTFLFLRLGVALSLFGHGLVRLPKLQAFSEGVAEQFGSSLLPTAFVLPYGYVIAITEFTVGMLLIIGLFTRPSLIVGATLMLTLIFGSCLIENFGALPSQLIHLAFLGLLIQFIAANAFSLDSLLKNKRKSHV